MAFDIDPYWCGKFPAEESDTGHMVVGSSPVQETPETLKPDYRGLFGVSWAHSSLLGFGGLPQTEEPMVGGIGSQTGPLRTIRAD